MTQEKLLIICLDGFKFDCLRQTKFLKKLAQKNQSGRLETLLGYSAIPATFLTGKAPDEHGVWAEFSYSPPTSPFKLLTFLQFLDKTIFEKPARLLATLFYNGLRFLSGHNYFFRLPRAPLKTIANFDSSLKNHWVNSRFKKGENFFARLKKKKIPYLCFEWPMTINNDGFSLDFLTQKNDSAKTTKLLKNLDRAQVFWLRLGDLDTVGHQFGTRSKQTTAKLAELDRLCEKIINQASRYHVKFLFWSDHGMVDVKKRIDVQDQVKDLNLLIFLDSALARFWVKDPDTKTKLLERLKAFKEDGHLLSEKEKKHHRLNFSDNRYGDVVFLANPGVLIFPNFYQKEKPVKAMHGYDPHHPDQQGVYILSSNKKRRQDKNMAQLYQELIKLANL